MPKETNVSSLRQSHVRATFGPMDIKMPPIKMHMLHGHMVPSLGSTTRFFNQKHRRVSLEIIEPFGDGAANQLTVAWDPENETLHDKDQVVLRFFRKRKQKRSQKQKKMFGFGGHDDDQAESEDDDGSSVSTFADSVADAHNEWRLHSVYRSDDIEILNDDWPIPPRPPPVRLVSSCSFSG